MKKKFFTSKLQLQKTTVVSFNALVSLKGGALQNVDTQIISVDDLGTCIPSTINTCPTTQVDNTCPPPTPPTNTGGQQTDFCGAVITKINCLNTRRLC